MWLQFKKKQCFSLGIYVDAYQKEYVILLSLNIADALLMFFFCKSLVFFSLTEYTYIMVHELQHLLKISSLKENNTLFEYSLFLSKHFFP